MFRDNDRLCAFGIFFSFIFEMDAAEDMAVCRYYPLESHMPIGYLTREEYLVELINQVPLIFTW